MASLNRVTILGQLGSDPSLKNGGGTRIALLSVATSTSWTDRAGQKQESTQWHRVKAFDKQADFAENYLGKGDTVLVEGSLETRSYDDKDGIKRYVTEIRALRVQSVRPRKTDGANDVSARNASYSPADANDEDTSTPF